MKAAEKFLDRLKVLPVFIMPQHGLSRLVGRLTHWRWRTWKDLLIRLFIRHYQVDMSDALEQDYHRFENFNAFFTRELRPGTRPLSADARVIACPVDGSISRIGAIDDALIIQAKGHDYSVADLLGGDKTLSGTFRNGRFATLYLSPRDYHRIHMPVDGSLLSMQLVPGRLFPVNPPSTRTIPRLFARNERVINIFSTEIGTMALVMIGALCVGSMDTVWAGTVAPCGSRAQLRQQYTPGAVTLEGGQEVGRFNMGSSVILLFEADRMEWLAHLKAGDAVRMGQELGKRI